jgi:hypothetical protein
VTDKQLRSWPLGVWAALLGITSLVLAGHAVATFPFALATGALSLLCLLGAKSGSFTRHYVLAAALTLAAVLLTFAWHRMAS